MEYSFNLELYMYKSRISNCMLLIISILCFLSCSTDDENDAVNLNFENTTSEGCVNIFVFASNASQDAFITISANQEELELDNSMSNFDLSQVNEDLLRVTLEIFDRSGRGTFCDDFGTPNGPQLIDSFMAISGDIEITLFDNMATILLSDLILKNDDNERIEIENVSIDNVIVGFDLG